MYWPSTASTQKLSIGSLISVSPEEISHLWRGDLLHGFLKKFNNQSIIDIIKYCSTNIRTGSPWIISRIPASRHFLDSSDEIGVVWAWALTDAMRRVRKAAKSIFNIVVIIGIRGGTSHETRWCSTFDAYLNDRPIRSSPSIMTYRQYGTFNYLLRILVENIGIDLIIVIYLTTLLAQL